MRCAAWQEMISARADGEFAGVDGARLDAHLARCASCRAYAATTSAPLRSGRPVGAIPRVGAMPDLSGAIARRVAADDRSRARQVARWGLLVIAVQIAILAVGELAGGSGAAVHASRHVGAFALAFAMGLLLVVIRPARAHTMLPVAAVLTAALVITAAVDLIQGRVPLVNETRHLPEVVGLVLLWTLDSPRRPSGQSRGADAERNRAGFHVVRDNSADVAS